MAAIATFVALMFIAVDPTPQHGDAVGDALGTLRARVGAYETLRRDAASHLPGLTPFEDSCTYLSAQAEMASAITAARPTARQGDIFTPAVAAALRQTIGDALCGRDMEGMFDDLDGEPSAVARDRLHVHDRYPAWATHEVPAIVLQRLPSLPEGIFFRFVSHDLVLWDADADLVVDVLPDAISTPLATPGGCRRARLLQHSGGDLLARHEHGPKPAGL